MIKIKGRVVEVVRKSNIMRIVMLDKVLNIVSAYAPQMGCEESKKKKVLAKDG